MHAVECQDGPVHNRFSSVRSNAPYYKLTQQVLQLNDVISLLVSLMGNAALTTGECSSQGDEGEDPSEAELHFRALVPGGDPHDDTWNKTTLGQAEEESGGEAISAS